MTWRLSNFIISYWDNSGKLKDVRTSGGHRRYKLSDLEKFIGEYHVEGKETDDVIVATYARCSTSDQKQHGDIDRQSQRLSEYCAKKKYKVEYIIKDMGSVINDKRKGFVKLCKLITDKKSIRLSLNIKTDLYDFNIT